MANLDAYGVGNVAWLAGFRGDSPGGGLTMAIAISMTEDPSGDPTRDSPPNADQWHSIDRGLWQINNHWHPEVTDAEAHDPLASAQAAYRISSGGRDWTPWSTFNSGAYRNHLVAAQAAATAITNAGGTSVGTSAATPNENVPTSGYSPDVGDSLVSVPLANEWQPIHQIDDLFLGGATLPENIALLVADTSSIDLSIDQVSQMDVIIEDPQLLVLKYGLIALGIAASWQDINLELTSITTQGGNALEEVDIIFRAAGAGQMVRDRGSGQLDGTNNTWNNISPTDLMAQLARSKGLNFVGKGSAPQDIARNAPTNPAAYLLWESDWDIGKRLAATLGYWAFEAGGTYYFAPPSWLVTRLVTFKVGWRGSAGDPAYDAIDVPKCFRSEDTLMTGAEITVTLPRERGEQIRCGMTMLLSGIPGFEGPYITSHVQWPLDNYSPVTVTAMEPKDPVPTLVLDTGVVSIAPTQPGTASALDFVTMALRQVGKPYQLGGGHNQSDANPSSFDCASLVAWAAAQVGIDPKTLGGSGVTVTTLVNACIDAHSLLLPAGSALSGGWYPLAELTAGVPVGLATRGALMFVGNGAPNGWEHVAISLGDGHSTVQATHTGSYVLVINQENDFIASGLVPGLNYGTSAKTGPGMRAA